MSNFPEFLKKAFSKKRIILVVMGLALISGVAYASVYKTSSNNKNEPQKQSQSENDGINGLSGTKTNTMKPDSQQTAVTRKCWQEDIPYETVKQPATWLYEGETEIANRGIVGKKQVCIDDQGNKSETIITKAFDQYINVGTKKREQANTQPQEYTYSEALSLATQACKKKIPAGSWDSTDMNYCKTKEMKKYGY